MYVLTKYFFRWVWHCLKQCSHFFSLKDTLFHYHITLPQTLFYHVMNLDRIHLIKSNMCIKSSYLWWLTLEIIKFTRVCYFLQNTLIVGEKKKTVNSKENPVQTNKNTEWVRKEITKFKWGFSGRIYLPLREGD